MEPGDIAATIADALRPQPVVVAAYLFGSIAAGRAHRESDVDVAVLLDRSVAPHAAERFEHRLRLSAVLIAALHRNDIDLLVLKDAPPQLARAVVLNGRRVHVADHEQEHAFRRDSMLRAVDLEPLLRRTRRRKLAMIVAALEDQTGG
jgi:predicted nucleotidyltransferase